jgi:hypothetical protein
MNDLFGWCVLLDSFGDCSSSVAADFVGVSGRKAVDEDIDGAQNSIFEPPAGKVGIEKNDFFDFIFLKKSEYNERQCVKAIHPNGFVNCSVNFLYPL